MIGVLDGHGLNGHLVSDFIKKTMPVVLANLILGGNGTDPIVSSQSQKAKHNKRNSKHFLPPLVGG